jgi:Zn-dependent peptidase ImmA (M78 family)/transcriptional regulator with XRE-family HTH domain
MPVRHEVTSLNPRVLVWARETTGRSIEDVAERLDKTAAVVRAWEEGTAAPTYAELEKLAYQVLKRPLAVFFFPEPPEEPTPENSFRTLPEFGLEDLAAETRYRIREARAQQLALRDLFESRNPAEHTIVPRNRKAGHDDPKAMARRLREQLGVSLETQTTVWRTNEQAVEGWRAAFERGGVFVFKNSLKQKQVSGFCLYDDAFPLIVLNNSTSFARQIFTMFHELGHLLSHTGGITKADDRYLEALKGENRQIEVFCNAFAAAFLVPEADFRARTRALTPDDRVVANLASLYKVSRETVLRRFFDEGRVSKATYERKAGEWKSDYDRNAPKEGGGGDYYATKVAYLSPTFLSEVFRRYLRGDLQADGAASLLNVKTSSLAGLEEVVLQKVAV